MCTILTYRCPALQIGATILPLILFATLAKADIFQWEYINPADPSQGKRESTVLAPDGAGVDAAPGANLLDRNLTKAYLVRADLRGAFAWFAVLTDAALNDANLTDAFLDVATLTNADFTGAEVRGAFFGGTTYTGFTPAQLYSTASYQARNLTGIYLDANNLTAWNFAGQNLSSASFANAALTNADLAGANLTNAALTSANLSHAILTNAHFDSATLRRANLTYANFGGATMSGADLSAADARGAIDLNLSITSTTNLIGDDGHIKHLNLGAGEKLIAYAGVPIPVTITGDFSIATDATFDLTDNAAIFDYPDATPVAVVRERILSGRGGPGLGAQWKGTGITSSTAAADVVGNPESRSIGYAENATLPLGQLTVFHGVPVDGTSILLAYTRTGDANLDGVINNDDVTIVGANYAPGIAKPIWALGDFDYNGFVDNDDVTLLGVFYDPSAAPLSASVPVSQLSAAAVPEPPTLVLAFVFAVGLLHKSRRDCACSALQSSAA